MVSAFHYLGYFLAKFLPNKHFRNHVRLPCWACWANELDIWCRKVSKPVIELLFNLIYKKLNLKFKYSFYLWIGLGRNGTKITANPLYIRLLGMGCGWVGVVSQKFICVYTLIYFYWFFPIPHTLPWQV